MQKKIVATKLDQAPTQTKAKTRTSPTFDDTEIGEIFNTIFYKRQKPDQLLATIILKTLFNNPNYKTAANELFEGVKNSKAVCAKVFSKNDIAFKCFDCEKDPTCVICKECYENGNHKGHRVLMQKSVSGCCDCGDPDAWNEKGFCCDHPGYANFKPTYSVDDIPAEFRENFLRVFEKCFFYLFNLYEEVKLCKQEDIILMGSLDDVLKNIMAALEFCGEKSMALWLLICKLFRTKLSENNRELYADTTNLKDMSLHSISKSCNFTYFEALVFYHQLNSENVQNKIQNICIKLFVDYDFKIYLAETFIKMIHFIFHAEKPEENKEGENSQSTTYAYTKLVGLDVQLFTAEEFAIIGINSEHFPMFLDLFDDLLKYCIRSPNYSSYEILMHFYAFLLYACQKTPSRKVLLFKEGAVKKILESLNNFNYCFKIDVTKKHNLNPGSVEDLVVLLEIEYKLLQIIDNIFVELSLEENKSKRLEFAQDLAEYFVNTIKRNDIKAFKESKEFNKYRSIHLPYYRAFTLFVKDLVEEPTTAGLEKLLKVDLKISDRNIEIIFLFLFQITLRTLTFTIDNEKKIWEFYSPIFDIFSSLYKNPKLKLLDCDLLLLQYSLVFIHPEDFCMVLETSASVNPSYLELFKSINAGKFDESKFHKGVQEIQKSARRNSTSDSVLNILKRAKSMSNSEESGKADVALDEFFNLIVMLCTDQVSHANLFYQKTKMFENVKHPEFCKNVYKDLVINLMQKQTKMSFKAMREVLSKKVIHEKADIEGGLNEIATFDTQSKTFQLKDKYLNHYEPFAFLKDAQLLVETQETLRNRLKKDKTPCDLIVGSNSYVYEYRYSLLDKIQGRLFEFPIIEFAVNCFIQSNQISKTPGLITRPVLKILHLALSYALHFKKSSLLTSLSKLLGTKEFADKLNELRDDTSCSELHPGIDKIIKLIAEVQQKSSIEGVEIVSPSLNVDDKIKSNQEAIRQRMSQIKKDFSQKRDNFLKKFKEEIKEEEQPTEENLVCYICHLNIGPDTEYGIPAFFSESSLYNLAFAQCKNRLKHKHTEEKDRHKVEDKIEEPAGEDDWESESESDDEEDVLEAGGSEVSGNELNREEEKVPEQQPERKKSVSKVPLEKKAFSPYPVVTSCSHNFHYIHKECFEKSARKRTGVGSGFAFSNEMEYSCTFCKSLCNIFISENPSVFKPNEQEQEENIEVEIPDIKSVLQTTEQLKEIPTNHLIVPDLIFNDVMLLQVFKEDQLKNTKNSSLTNEDHILVTFDKLLAQCCHTVIFGGLEYFIKYSFNLYKPIQSSYKQFYKAHISNTKTEYFKNKKNLLVRYLDLLLSGENSQPLDHETDHLLFRDSPDSKIALFATPDEFIFDVLQHIVIASELTPKLESLFITRVLRIYLLHKIVQVYIKEKLSKDTKEQITLETFLKDLALGMSSPIKAELVNGILPSVRKIVVFILLNLYTPKETIDSLAKGDYLNDEEELNAYLKITCLNTTADALFSTELFDYSGVSNEIVRAWINTAHPQINKGIDSLTPYIMMADQEVMFTFTELPDNYYDLSMYYIEQKCQICNNRSESGNQCVCLLCGMILCNFSCTKKAFSNTQRGNLNHHSIHYHAGESAFLNVESGTIFLIKSPKNVDYGPLYIDRLGYAIEEKGKDWRQYKIDVSRLEILREKFVCEKVAQEITYNIINNNKKYYDFTL